MDKVPSSVSSSIGLRIRRLSQSAINSDCHPTLLVSGLQESDLKRLHEGAIKNDPYIAKALGPNAEIERMKAASLRLGGQGLKTTYDDHLVIIGDAAGHIDPLTGEGIHTAIMVSCTLQLST